MKLMKRIPMILQLAAIAVISITAAYFFQQTETAYQVNGLCFYRYLAYFATVVLGYVCFAHYSRYVGLVFASTLLVLAFSPIGHLSVMLFPSIVPFLAMLMGITTILVVPSSRGKGFFEYLALLVFPAILAESRIGGSFRLIATIQSIGTHELAAGTVIIVGGYFYLRYATLTNLKHLELLDNGGGKEDVAEISWRSNIVAAITVLSASGLAALLLASTSSVSDAFRTAVGSFPLLSLALALFAGLAVTIFLYTLQLTRKQEDLQRTHVNRNRHAR